MGAMLSNLSERVYGKKQLFILMVRRGFAGKSTILHQFVHREFIQINNATIGFDTEPVEYKDVVFLFSEIGGQLKGTPLLWKSCFNYAPAMILVVDSTHRERIEESRDELHDCMKEIKGVGKKANVLVYANKQDLPHAMSVTEVADILDLHSLDQHPWHVQAACAVTGKGLHEGLNWLYRHLST